MTSEPNPLLSTPMWHRYVAIGDSFTESLMDEDPGSPGAFRGWADRLAEQLAAVGRAAGHEVRYANLAIRGRLLADVVGGQLDHALALGPDLVSMIGGGNDIMRPSVDVDDLAARLEEAVVRIRATGADVLLATPTDPRDAGVFKPLRRRHAVHAANVLTIARTHGAFVLNVWAMPWIRDWRMWAADRIHPSSEAHRRLALEAALSLGLPVPPGTEAAWRDPLPPAAAIDWRSAARENRDWLREHAVPWMTRRLRGESSGDRLSAKRPELTPVIDAKRA